MCVLVFSVVVVGKRSKGSSGVGGRERVNPVTGLVERVAGTKAGRKRVREPEGSVLRTHDRAGRRATGGKENLL